MNTNHIILIGLVFPLFLSGCTRVAFDGTGEASFSSTTNGIVINEEDPFTNNTTVRLTLLGLGEQEMYVTNDPTCEAGGEWESYIRNKEWVLSQSNKETSVYIQFRTDRSQSDCFSDSIVHDDVPPQVEWERVPEVYSRNSSDYFTVKSTDNLSGVSAYYCTRNGNLEECGNRVEFSELAEGDQGLSLFVEDKAGNVSPSIDYQWVVDFTPPLMQWTETPSALSNLNIAQFKFAVADNHTLVQNIELVCRLDNTPLSSCKNTLSLQNLLDGRHTLSVQGKDRTGNISTLNYAWSIDQTPPLVQIIKSPYRYSNQALSEFKFLVVDAHPKSSFECSLDRSPFVICQEEERFSLREGQHVLVVRARDLVGNISPEVSHQWWVDLTPPSVEIISAPSSSQGIRDARFTFNVTESGSGILWSRCQLNQVESECASPVNYTNLLDGKYRFEVYAQDRAGNRSPIKFHEWKVGVEAPTVHISSGPKLWSNATEAFLEFQGTEGSESLSHYECSINGGPFLICQSPHKISALKESSYTFQVVAYDVWGTPSGPASYYWNIDLTPPVAGWVEVPSRHDIDDDSFAHFFASDKLSGVKEAHCQINSHNVNCAAGQRFQTHYLVRGQNEMIVNIFDEAGNATSISHGWEAFSPFRLVNQTVLVDESDDDIDILFVVDNSTSMDEEQDHMARRIKNFVQHLHDLDWRIAVTTTYTRASANASDGKLATFVNGNTHLDVSLPTEMAQDYLSQAVKRPTSSSASKEQGIRNTYRMIERARDINPDRFDESKPNRDFLRDPAHMAVVLLSDEDESDTKHRNKASNLINFVNNIWGGLKSFVFHSIIVKEGDKECLDNGGYTEGLEYTKLSKMTGGIIGSICEPDYSSQLSDIGVSVRNQIFAIELDCLPVDRNGDGQIEVVVELENGISPPPFSRDKTTMTFQRPLPIGQHSVKYFCHDPLNPSLASHTEGGHGHGKNLLKK